MEGGREVEGEGVRGEEGVDGTRGGGVCVQGDARVCGQGDGEEG